LEFINQISLKGKYYIILFLLLCSTLGLAQTPLPVKINRTGDPQSLYSPEQLIEDVLIDSPCTVVSNFSNQVSGNPTDNTTKSYGYFINSGNSPTFPFQEGIVLTTGRAFPAGNNAAGLINNQNGLPGDADLEIALGQPNTFDATFIKFTFTPVADKISFRYFMASEEYDGETECLFADSFAFLLREVGGFAYTNLAVLPDGTPVSVTNINNSSLINPSGVDCDANIPYFEGYNIGDTNYGGRTVVLTASADVIPNQPYEIKLVVADQGDCIDCMACVNVCPMGIDIRDGQQMACITCGLCIDACNDVMDRIGKPRDLIGYMALTDEVAEIAGKEPKSVWKHVFRARTIMYTVLWSGVGIALVVALFMRSEIDVNVTPVRNPTFVTLSDGAIRNTYDVRLLNKQGQDEQFHISLTSDAPLRIALEGTSELTVTVKANEQKTQRVYVIAEPGSLAATSDRTQLRLWIEQLGSTNRVSHDTIFNGKGD